jgi:hypothetical protein
MNRFYDKFQVVTTNNYNIVADFHNKSLRAKPSPAFTSRCLATALNNSHSSAMFLLDVSW